VHAAVGLRATLQAVAEGVTSSTPYTEVTVTTAWEPDAADLHVEAVVGPPDAVAMLLGTTCPHAALEEHLAGGEAWGALRFWSHFGRPMASSCSFPTMSRWMSRMPGGPSTS
jgi:hypothetical protein